MKTKIDIVRADYAELKSELQQAINAIEINVNNIIEDIKISKNDTDEYICLIIYKERDKEKTLLNESDDVYGVIGLDE